MTIARIFGIVLYGDHKLDPSAAFKPIETAPMFHAEITQVIARDVPRYGKPVFEIGFVQVTQSHAALHLSWPQNVALNTTHKGKLVLFLALALIVHQA